MEQQLKLAEKNAEIQTLWAVGDAVGPLADEVKIGVCSRRSFAKDVMYRVRQYRSRPVVHRAEVLIRGECAGARLRTAVFAELDRLNCRVASQEDWFAAAGKVASVIAECAYIGRFTLLTEDEARAIELQELEKVQAQMGKL